MTQAKPLHTPQFERELTALMRRHNTMLEHVSEQLKLVGDVFFQGDSAASTLVESTEVAVNASEAYLQHQTIRLVALFSPNATDLRVVIGSPVFGADVERIGDEACNLVGFYEELVAMDAGSADNLDLFVDLYQGVCDYFEAVSRLHTSREQSDSADSLIERDETINDLYKECLTKISSNAASLGERTAGLVLIARSFERIGDHCKNLAQSYEFMYGSTYKLPTYRTYTES